MTRTVLLLGLLVLASASVVVAQRGLGDLGFNEPVKFVPAQMPDGNFTICRLMYTSVRREPNGGGWRTDFPYGEINLLTRLSELTKTPVSYGAERPNQWVVRLTDDGLFNCPYTVASDVGTMGLDDAERIRLREYLLKGGFLWVDDFWGTLAWQQWSSQIGQVLPSGEYPIEDVPMDDPIFHAQFVVSRIPQITNIQFWRGVRGLTTSERGPDSREAHFRGIRDQEGRLMVVMTHNTDVADSWEREGEDPAFFYQFSPDGYALGINVLLYALTH